MKIVTCATLSASMLSWGLAFAGPREHRALPENLQKTSNLIGMKVENTAGENLGKIEDVVIDTTNGRIAYGVLSFGGFLGIGDKLFAIPWQALKENQAKKICCLALDKESLKNAPGFDKKNWPDMTDPKWRSQIHEFYKVPLYGRGGSPADLGLTDIKRESTQLLLNLRQGTAVSYNVSCDKEREVHLQVMSATGDESTVQVTCEGKDEARETCTVQVSKDGTVRFEDRVRTDKEPAAGLAPGAKEKIQILVQHIFGQGLHREKLEPGKEYTMPGAFHGFELAGSAPARSTDEGALRRETSISPGATAPSSATAETHVMRFEGTAKREGNAVAVFSVPGSSSEGNELRIRPTEPRPGENRPGAATRTGEREGQHVAAATGKAVYRTDDGLLDAMVLDGLTVRRLDAKSDLGN